MEKIEKIYTAHATATGGRNGHVASSDGVLDLEVRMPKEMGGSGGAYTNPEQLFAAGYAACFDSALNLVIRTQKVTTGTTTVTAAVSLGKNNNGGYGLSVKLQVAIPDVAPELAQELIEKAHQVCPYSNATRGNIEVELALI
jgi:Ohr subfamily peroxiredoxin